MDSSESSSENECNIYVNAASKLNALNCQAKSKDYDNEPDDLIIINDSKNSNSPQLYDNTRNYERTNPNNYSKDSTNEIFCVEDSTNDSCDIDKEFRKSKKRVKKRNVKKNSTTYIPDDDACSNYGISTQRPMRNSNKQRNQVPVTAEPIITINDTIEEELDMTFNIQEQNDSYIVIGSPSPVKTIDTDNYEVSVKVLWRSNKMNRFEIRRYETFQKIFQHFAKTEGVPQNQIVIMKKDKCISPFDSPASIDWSIIDILDGGILSPDIAKKKHENSDKNNIDESICKIKIQISDKKFIHVTLKPNQPCMTLLHCCSEQLNIPKSKLKLYFDGELIDTDETPESLDLDDEACIDLKIVE